MSLLEPEAREDIPPAVGWDYKYIRRLAGGLNRDLPSEDLQDHQLITLENIRYNEGIAITDFGYKKFGQAIRGDPRLTYQYFDQAGASILLLITNLTVYRYNVAEAEWQYPSNGTKTTLSAGETGGATAIDVVSETGFATGEHVGIILDDGTQHQTTVASVAPGIINIDVGLPSIASIGNEVVEAVLLAGSSDIPVSIDTWAAFDKAYFTNGVDTPKEFDGTDVVDISNLPGTTFTCQVIRIFFNSILLMHTTRDGTTIPQQVRWSVFGLDNDFNEFVNFLNLYDSEDFILTAERLGNFMMLYRQRSIVKFEFFGSAAITWRVTTMISGEGVLSGESVVNLDDSHLVFGNSNIYEYKGTFDLPPIGDNIRELLYGRNGKLNPGRIARAFAFYVEETDEAWFLFAKTGDEFPKSAVKMEVAKRTWTTREFGIELIGFGFFQSQVDLTWDSAPGTWDDFATVTWDSRQLELGAPTLHLCSRTNLRVYEYDYLVRTDDAVAIAYVLETKDFLAPDREYRFDRYDFRMAGDNILTQVSLDRGVTFKTLKTFSVGFPANLDGIKKQSVHKQLIGESIRFKFTGTTVFAIHWLGFKYREERVGR